MFEIDRSAGAQPRLRSTAPLTSEDFEQVARQLGAATFKARKVGYVAAVASERTQDVETMWNGSETRNVARPGDWIVTNMTGQRQVMRDGGGQPNTYVIKAETFPKLYEAAEGENEFGQVYKAKGVVDALLLPGGFDIAAPWGERQVAGAGYLVRNGTDVYGNQSDTFEATYERMR